MLLITDHEHDPFVGPLLVRIRNNLVLVSEIKFDFDQIVLGVIDSLEKFKMLYKGLSLVLIKLGLLLLVAVEDFEPFQDSLAAIWAG